MHILLLLDFGKFAHVHATYEEVAQIIGRQPHIVPKVATSSLKSKI